MREIVDHCDERAPALSRGGKRSTEQHGNQQDLQYISRRKSACDGVGNNVHQELDCILLMRRSRITGESFRVDGGRIQVKTAARMKDMSCHEPDHERERRHDFEVEQRLAAYSPDFLHVAHSGNAGHDGAEDNRPDHHLDQLDERVAKRFHLHGKRRREMPEQHANNDRDEHMKVKRAIERLPCAGRGRGHDGALAHEAAPARMTRALVLIIFVSIGNSERKADIYTGRFPQSCHLMRQFSIPVQRQLR